MKKLMLLNPLFWIGTGGIIGQGMMWILCDSTCGKWTSLVQIFWVIIMFMGFAFSGRQNTGKKDTTGV